MDNYWIWIIVALLLWQGMRILQFIIFLYYKFRFPVYKLCQKDDIDVQVQKLLVPYEEHLLKYGFEYQYTVQYKSMIVGSDLLIYKLYYYNEEQGIHAFLETMPYKGSLEPIKLSYETIYENKKICSTENGMAHFIPAIPKEIYLFDHYLASWSSVLEEHLKDRIIDGEKILKQPFNQEGWLAYLTYCEHIYMDANIEQNIAIKTTEGYRYKASFALWKFAKKSTNGYKKFSNILKQKIDTMPSAKDDTNVSSQTEGLLMQMQQVYKSRGKSQNKKRWFFLSIIAFSVLFLLVGFSLVDLISIIVVLVIHELGHFLAMRYYGYSDTSILFLPFGAITTGHKEKRNAYEEFIISLMGPLPGIIIGIIFLISVTQYGVEIFNHSVLNTYAMMSIIINYINLLPIYPLDGGKILQTLLLSRYPKGQFYFYIIGLAILTVAMLWMRDPILLIFVVLIAFGLKNSYLISEVLKKLFSTYKQENITKENVASLLMKDEKFTNENLASKARIAKQALMVIETKKPSKALMVFGMGFYLLLLSPTLIVGYLGLRGMHQSSYSNLSKEGKIELRTFNKTVLSYEGLTKIDKVVYTSEESMHILDDDFNISKVNRKIGERLNESINISSLPCDISKEQLKILQWHNGIEQFLPYQKLFSYQEIIDTHTFIKKENESYGEDTNTEYVLSIGDEESYGLAYSCKEEGLYDFSPYGYDSSNKKKYYNWNHFLKITVEAYRVGAYREENGKLNIDEKKFAKIERQYYSSVDKKRYSELIEYLKNRAKIYKDTKDNLLKITLLQSIGNTYDTSLLETVKIYLDDKDKKVQEQAIYTLGKVGDKSTLPLLISYTKSKDNTKRNFSLLSISEIVDNNDKEILQSLYSLLDDEDILVRLSLYAVINKIEDIESLSKISRYFNQEKPSGKLAIINIFSKFGTKNELSLLKQYLKEVNKMDMSQDFKGGFRGSDPHPKILKKHTEDAIKAIESREVS